jgi:hypothetical protein
VIWRPSVNDRLGIGELCEKRVRGNSKDGKLEKRIHLRECVGVGDGALCESGTVQGRKVWLLGL